jgi:CelD/BcsL family acetyltransferase involved in cellulose biosynthesis
MLAPRVTCSTEWRPLAALSTIKEAWRALASRAADPNVFYEPAFALPAASAFGADAGALLAWSQETPSRLIGLWPACIERRRYGFAIPVLVGFTHPYGPLGVPLIDRDHTSEVVAAFLDHIARDRQLPDLALLSYIPEAGAFAAALTTAVSDREGRVTAFDRHVRALLAPGEHRHSYFRRALRKKKRHDLARQRRRLAKSAPLEFEVANTLAAVAAAFPSFLVLEASGWKGRTGTAAVLQPHVKRFMEAAIAGLAAEGKASVARLIHGGKPIAAALIFRSGGGAWFWKIAYDEAFARASPGSQITVDLGTELLRQADIPWVDSCAAPGNWMDRLWRERLPLADYLVATGPQAQSRFAIAERLEATRRSALAVAKLARAFIPAR